MDKLRIPGVSLPKLSLPYVSPIGHPDEGDYIRDGLVFWLDGIDKGGVDGKWIDKVGGVYFALQADEVQAAGVLVKRNIPCATGEVLNYPYKTSTIEACFTVDSFKDNNVFDGGFPSGLAIGYYANSKSIYGCVHPQGICFNCPTFANGRWPHSVSFANALAMMDKQRLVYQRVDAWNTSTVMGFKGKWASANPVFHSVRIYDRLLTEEEMRHNQEVDCRRFNLTFPDPIMTLEYEEYLAGLNDNGQ